MKIVYLLSYFELVGGQEFFLARQQAKQGHDVTVIASDVPYPIPGLHDRYRQDGFTDEQSTHRPGKIQYDGMTIYRLHSLFHYQDFILVGGVEKLLLEIRPDIIFGHEPRTMVPIISARLKKKLDCIYILDSHDFFHKVQNHAWWQRVLRYTEYFWWRRWFVDYAYRQADLIIPVADDCRNFMMKTHHITADRIRQLPLGLETDYFHYDEQTRISHRQKLGLAETDIVLLFAGYMFRRKALESLIDAVAKLKDLPLKLVFAGDGPADYITELKAQVEKLGVQQKVIFAGVGGRPQMIAHYCAADIGVWPGNNSLVVMEAMACRLPVIMADMQLAHLVKHGNGRLVPYGDTSALEAAIAELAKNPSLRKEMGLAGERSVLEQYSYMASARLVSSWMEELLAKKAKA